MEFYEIAGFDESPFRCRFFDYTGTRIPYSNSKIIENLFISPFNAAVVHDGIHANECEVESGASRQDVLDLMLDKTPLERRLEYCI